MTDLLRTEIVIRGDKALAEEPVTITAYRAERSAGGIHDFYSEGDYWWPNPINPDSAYIRRDGQTNPDNFVAHRHAMIRFSSLVGDLTSAWLVTKDEKYIRQAVKHIRAWFIAPETRMNPDLQYAQAIKGIVTGRGIGIIDTIHLLEVVQSLIKMEEAGVLAVEDVAGSRTWFSDYLKWLTTHPYGVDEMNAKNNHGTCWVMQVAQFAKYTGDKEILDFCRNRYRSVLLPSQMAEDGSFPLELKRTKPYGYSLFNLDAMATICHILSDGEDDETARQAVHVAWSRLKKTLVSYGLGDIVRKGRGFYALNRRRIRCDCWEMLEENEDRYFMGGYMPEYSWAEVTLSYLLQKFEEIKTRKIREAQNE